VPFYKTIYLKHVYVWRMGSVFMITIEGLKTLSS